MVIEFIPFALVLFTLVGAFIMPFLARWFSRGCIPLTLGILGLDFFMAGNLLRGVAAHGPVAYYIGGWPAPWGIEVRGDGLAAIMLILICFIMFWTVVYGASSMEREITPGGSGWYCTLLLLITAGMMGLVVSGDLFNMYVMIEVVTLSGCALVLARGGREVLPAALKYLLLATIGSGFILFGIAFTYLLTGHLNLGFAAAELMASGAQYPYLNWIALTFMVIGLAVKAGLFPLHVWLPDAHSTAPSTSSAVLSGLVVKVYAVVVMRVFFQLYTAELLQATDIDQILLIMSIGAILAGSFFALVQTDLKRLLAYSTVAQVGYIFLGISVFSITGLEGAIFHIAAHALMKSMLFLAAGVLIAGTGSRYINDLKGMGRAMPFAGGIFALGAFSMIGLPLLAGFISKYLLALAGWETGNYLVLPVMVLSGLLNAAYYLPVLRVLFWEEAAPLVEKTGKERGPLIALAALAGGLLIMGVMPEVGRDFIQLAAAWLWG